MATTEEEIRKNIEDANTQAAVAALQAQVDKSRAAYGNMNRDIRAAAAEGTGNIRETMQAAGLDRNVGTTAGMVIGAAAGEAAASNRQAMQLGARTLGNQINYLRQSGAERQETLAKNEAEWQRKITEQKTKQEKALTEQQDAFRKAEAQQKAKTLAQYGDFSGYGEMGYTPEQTGGMKAAYDRENAEDNTFRGLGSYAQMLLTLYEGNKGYDLEAALQQALQNGLITQQEYEAAKIQSGGIRHQEPEAKAFSGLGSYAQTLLSIYEGNKNYDIRTALQQALQNGLITQQEHDAALIQSGGIRHEEPETKDFSKLGSYAQTLLSIYEGNKNYDIRGALQEALQNGLITQQDHDAALIQSSGIRHEEPAPEDYAGLEGFAETLLDIYETNENFDVMASLQEALQNGLITQQDYNAAVIAARGIVPGGKNKKTTQPTAGTTEDDDPTKWPEYAAAEAALNRATLLPNGKYLVTNSEDWAALKTFYDKKEENIGKYFEFEEEKLTVPVYGDITYSEAEKLEQQGYLIMTGVATDGTPIYSVPPRKPGMVNAMW